MRYNKHMRHIKNNQKGAVSLFVIIFAALLISVITVSFTRLMISEQQQAVVVDLSKSANDSALAGIEDVKRVMAQYQVCLDDSTKPGCAKIISDINSTECNEFVSNVVSVNSDEVLVQQSTNDLSLNQAYTCTLVQMQTPDFKGSLQPNGSKIIPLVGVSAFSSVTIRWFSNSDMQNVSDVDLESESISKPLYTPSNWPVDRPPIVRVQLMQYGSDFTLSSFDENSSGSSNNSTVFLYPNGTKGVALSDSRSPDEVNIYGPRKSATIIPRSVTCSGDISAGGYACSAEIILPSAIGGGDRNAFLRLSSIYHGSSYSVELNDSSGVVNFDGVQPAIDSTGRANDIFRRVQSRVEMSDPNFPYPNASVDITGNFCKNFVVTDNAADYSSNCAS